MRLAIKEQRPRLAISYGAGHLETATFVQDFGNVMTPSKFLGFLIPSVEMFYLMKGTYPLEGLREYPKLTEL